MAWTWWAVAAGLLLLAEGVTATLAFAMAAAGAVVAAILSAGGAPLLVQLPAFAAVSIGLIGFLRPAVTRRQNLPGLRTGVAALIGRDALVTSRVDGRSGRVDLGGQAWSARALDPDAVFEPGSTVHIAEIDGATALVV
jgi:membrane protein implicated in regulation of membrane protease activity